MAFDEDGLTHKQKAFIQAYLSNGGNATQAAKTAGYSTRTAKQMGYEVMTKPYVRKYMRERMQEQAEKLGITASFTLGALKESIEVCKLHLEVKTTNGKTYLNSDAHTALNKSIAEIHKVLGAYPEEKKDDKPASAVEDKEELLDKCRKDC